VTDVVTRTCEDCDQEFARQDLTPTARGTLNCPDCGNILETYGNIDLTDPEDYVLALGSTRNQRNTFHLVSYENPVEPRCQTAFSAPAAFRPTKRDALGEEFSLCENCRQLVDGDSGRTSDQDIVYPVTTDLSTTVWYSAGGDVYHADRGGLCACPEMIPHVKQHTLSEAVAADKRPCPECQPAVAQVNDHDSRSTTLGDFA